MTEIEGSVRCPRGHATAAGYQFCTTCGERIAPDPLGSDPGRRPTTSDQTAFVVPADDARSTGAPRRSLFGGLRRAKKAPVSVSDMPEPEQDPRRRSGRGQTAADARGDGSQDPARAAGDAPSAEPKKSRSRYLSRRASREPKPGTTEGPSLLPPDLLPPELGGMANEPPRTDPPEIEPGALPAPLGSSTYKDVEFAIGPDSSSVVTFDRADVQPVPVTERVRTVRRGRGPDIPTRVMAGLIAAIVVIAALIVFFLVRDPRTPSATLVPAEPTTSAGISPTPSVAPVPTAVAVSEECGNAFAFAAAHAAEAQAPTWQQRTLDLCTTPDEWLTAARLHPTAIGATSAADVGDDDLARLCAGASGAVCAAVTSATPVPPTSAVTTPP